MKFIAATLAVAVGQVAASGWTDAPSFSCPSKSENQCNTQQESGWSWGDLDVGNFDSYSGFSFNGWSCDNSFDKRDLTERGFQDKCITGSLSKGSGPSFSCGSESKGFSIDTYQITVSEEVEVEFVYQMEGGETCKHTKTCSPGGTEVKNTQCGGAKQVSFQLGSGSSSSCSIGVHSIGFYCNSATSSAQTPTSTPAKSVSSPVVSTPSSAPVNSSPTKSNSATPSSPAESSSATPSSPAKSNSATPSSPAESSSATPSSPVSKSSPAAPSSPAVSSSVPYPVSSLTPSSPAPSSGCPGVVPSCLNTWLELTTCMDNSDSDCFCQDDTFTANVIACVQSWGDDVDVQLALSYIVGICAPYIPQHPGIVTNCPSSIPLSPTGSPTTTPAAPPVTETETALTTVIVSTTVTTCPAGQTVTHASGTTVLASPSTSTIYLTTTSTICKKCEAESTPAVSSSPAGPITASKTQYTTITITTSVTVPCTYSTGSSSGQPIPSSSTVSPYSTCVTVPQVVFTTASAAGTSSPSVGLVQGSPTAAPKVASTPVGGVATTTGFVTSLASAPKASGSGTKSNGTFTSSLPAQVTTNAGVMVSFSSILSLSAAIVVAALAM